MELTSSNVSNVVYACLFEVGDMISEQVLKPQAQPRLKDVKGVRSSFGFDMAKINQHRADIESMIEQLPDEFHEGKGGGMTFLNACMTKDGTQWGEHFNVDELICLGMAIDKVYFPMPEHMWKILPGGMPYVSIKK